MKLLFKKAYNEEEVKKMSKFNLKKIMKKEEKGNMKDILSSDKGNIETTEL